MVLIQIDLPEEITKNLKIERIKQGIDTQAEVIIKILKQYFK